MKALFSIIIFLILAISCNNHTSVETTVKLSNRYTDESKLVKHLGVEPQSFNIITNKDTLINLKKGGRISISDSSFSNKEPNIKLTVKEIYSFADIILENMHSQSTGGILSSGGMIKVDCLDPNIQINPNHPILIEIPTFNLVDGMKCYNADISNNSFSWENPKELYSFLTTVPLDSLSFDFLMVNNNSDLLNITDQERQSKTTDIRDIESDSVSMPSCGVSYKLVKLLYSDAFSNSLISTKEFEDRMQYIHRSCDTIVFWLYVDNLDLNLFEIDKLAYDYLKSINNPDAGYFLAFSEQKLTKVKMPIIPHAEIINYKDKLYQEAYHYKMNVYDFGWYNIDKLLEDPRTKEINLITKLRNEVNFEEIQLKLLLPNKKVTLPLITKDEHNYYVNKKDMKLPLGEKAQIIFIGLKKNQTYFFNHKFTITNDINIEVTPEIKTPKEIIKSIHQLLPKEENMIYKQVKFCCNSIGS